MRHISNILHEAPPVPPFAEIGARLKQARRALGFSNQGCFGRAVGYAGRSISAMETGMAEPGFRVLRYLAQQGVDLNYLLTGVLARPRATAEDEINGEKKAEYFLMGSSDMHFFEQYCRSPEKIKLFIKLFFEAPSQNSDKST
jgi:transcriptional regulator with XRE-family HTH domain